MLLAQTTKTWGGSAVNGYHFYQVLASLFLITTMAAAPAFADNGSCSFKQQSPKTKEWVRVCQSPTTPETCREYAFDRLRGEVKYGDRACPTRGVTGVCSMSGGDMYFYEGKSRALIRGCEMMNGVWREDLLEQLKNNG